MTDLVLSLFKLSIQELSIISQFPDMIFYHTSLTVAEGEKYFLTGRTTPRGIIFQKLSYLTLVMIDTSGRAWVGRDVAGIGMDRYWLGTGLV